MTHAWSAVPRQEIPAPNLIERGHNITEEQAIRKRRVSNTMDLAHRNETTHTHGRIVRNAQAMTKHKSNSFIPVNAPGDVTPERSIVTCLPSRLRSVREKPSRASRSVMTMRACKSAPRRSNCACAALTTRTRTVPAADMPGI